MAEQATKDGRFNNRRVAAHALPEGHQIKPDPRRNTNRRPGSHALPDGHQIKPDPRRHVPSPQPPASAREEGGNRFVTDNDETVRLEDDE